MTNLTPVSVYTLHPDELENLGYDISSLSQNDFDLFAHRLARTLEDGPVLDMLDNIADVLDLPQA